MPIVKKAPGIMTREVKLEEPVNQLLEDYARFIESSADHVVNAVLKKVLWRDQDYRQWCDGGRTSQPPSAKGQHLAPQRQARCHQHTKRGPSPHPPSHVAHATRPP